MSERDARSYESEIAKLMYEVDQLTLERDKFKSTLTLAGNIVRQQNLLSTATNEEQCQTLERFINWWNYIVLPLTDKAYAAHMQETGWAKDRAKAITEQLGEKYYGKIS